MQKNFAIWVTNAVVITAFLAGNLVLVNLIAREVPLRADLTERNAYTVSEVTKGRLEKLKNEGGELVVTYHLSRETLPHSREYRTLEREVLDRLESYARYVPGKFTIKVLDPLDGKDRIYPEKREELAARNIVPVKLVEVEDGRNLDFEFYSTVKMDYRGHEVVVNQLSDARSLEYEFVTALDRLLEAKLPQIGLAFVLSEQEREWQAKIVKKVRGMLDGRAKIEEVDLSKGPAGTKDLDVLFVMVKDKVPAATLYEIDQYVMRGGRLVLCTDIFSLTRRAGGGRYGMEPSWEIFSTGTEDFTANFGARTVRELVFDLRDVQRYEDMIYRGGYAYLAWFCLSFEVRAKEDSFSDRFPLGRNLKALLFWFAHGFEKAEGAKEAGIEYEPLIWSSDKSWRVDVSERSLIGLSEITEEYMVSERAEIHQARWQRLQEEKRGEKGPFRTTIGAIVRGEFPSFFDDRPIPEGVSSENYDSGESSTRVETSGRKTILESPENRIVFLGDTDWLEKVDQSESNRDFLVHLTNYLAQREFYEELLGKTAPAPALYDEKDPAARDAFEGRKGWYMLLMAGLSPLLVVVTGIAKIVLRYQEKVSLEVESRREGGAVTATMPGTGKEE